jgi:hypothetical protein
MQRKPLILVSLLLAAFAINLDTTIVNVALPTGSDAKGCCSRASLCSAWPASQAD